MGLVEGVLTGCCRCPTKEAVVSMPCGGDTGRGLFTGEDRSSSSASTDALTDYKFDPFRFDRPSLCALYGQMLQALGLQEHFAIPEATIAGFVGEASLTYRDVPYHSFAHAFSVTQFLFAFYSASEGVPGILSKDDLLGMFVASVVHDADHPGNNNAWEVATKSPLAIRYGDEAVLERHHAAVGMRIMSRDRHDVLATLGEEAQQQVRKTYAHAILMTDMAQHSQMVVDMTKRGAREGQAFDRELIEERRALVGVLLHSADISNPLIPEFALCRRWAEKIKSEFWGQYTRELEQGLPPTQMWASLGTPLGFYKSQVGFIDFVVSPLWSCVFSVFPAGAAKGCLRESLGRNRSTWEAQVKSAEAEASSAKAQSDPRRV